MHRITIATDDDECFFLVLRRIAPGALYQPGVSACLHGHPDLALGHAETIAAFVNGG